jgi:transposase-like protein
VLPDHTPIGDGSLVLQEKTFIVDLRTQALELKQKGVSTEEAAKTLTAKFKSKYPDWRISNLTNFIQKIYAE